MQFTNEQAAAFFGVSVDRVKALHAKNADELAGMAAKAHRTGRKVNGYTERQLSQMVANSKARSK